MKKAIRILSVIAAAIMVLTCVLFLGMVLLQGVLGPAIFGYPEAVREHFVFPLPQAFYIFGITAVTVLLATTGGAEKVGIWVEILSACLVGVVLPLIQTVLNVAQTVTTTLQGQAQGAMAIAANGMVNALCGYATFLMPVAIVLTILAAGMSIAYKRMIRSMAEVID